MNFTIVGVMSVVMVIATYWFCIKCIRDSFRIEKWLKQSDEADDVAPGGNSRLLFDAAMDIALGAYRRDVRISIALGFAWTLACLVSAIRNDTDWTILVCAGLVLPIVVFSHKVGCSACIAYCNTKWKFQKQLAEEGVFLPPGI